MLTARAWLAGDTERVQGFTSGRRRVPTSPRAGIYDPILNEWQVQPDPREVNGLTFRPTTMFLTNG